MNNRKHLIIKVTLNLERNVCGFGSNVNQTTLYTFQFAVNQAVITEDKEDGIYSEKSYLCIHVTRMPSERSPSNKLWYAIHQRDVTREDLRKPGSKK